MDLAGAVVAFLVGCLQGVLEWLPVSSEGSIAVALTVADVAPDAVVRFALFVHAGTAVSALAYYWEEYEAAI